MSATGTVHERLLAAAGELFYAEGITAVGVERIRARADVAKSSLYEHFRSKDQLVAAYLQARSDGWRERLERALAAAGDEPSARLAAVFAELGAWIDEPGYRGCPFINASAELPDPAHPAAVVAEKHQAWVLDLMAEVAKSSGARNPERLARQLVMLYNAAMVEAQLGSATATEDAAAAAQLLLAAG